MPINIINESNIVGNRMFRKVVAAVQKQINNDLIPIWNPKFETNLNITNKVTRKTPVVHLVDQLPIQFAGPGVLGIHIVDKSHTPIAFIDVRAAKQLNPPWSKAFSHEVLEVIVDPLASFLIKNGNKNVIVEICDPVATLSYMVDGIEVADFVFPSWYRNGSAPFDKQDQVKSALTPFGTGSFFFRRRGHLFEVTNTATGTKTTKIMKSRNPSLASTHIK